MSHTKQWIMDHYDEFNYSHGERDGYRLRQMEIEREWQMWEEELEILNSELVEESFLLAGSCSPDCSVVATLPCAFGNSIELGQSVITNQNQSL